MPGRRSSEDTFYWLTWGVNTVWWCNWGNLCNITKENFLSKNIYEKCALETSSTSFLIFKKSSIKRNLRRSTCWFGQILVVFLSHIFNISSSLQKFNFPTEVVLNSLQTQKGLELVLRLQFSQNLLVIFFLL